MKISRDDDVRLDSIARLHMSCLPNSLFSILGYSVTKRMYSYLLKSKFELIRVLISDNGNVVGAVVVSFSANSFLLRLLMAPSVLFHIILNSYKIPYSMIFDHTDKKDSNDPELMFIFVDHKYRSLGLGRELMENTHQILGWLGVSKVLVSTENDKKNRAIPFYENIGYQQLDEFISYGRSFIRMAKELK